MKSLESTSDNTLSNSKVFSCTIRHFPLKRTFDILFSLVVLIVFAPLFLIFSIAIRATSPGRSIYYQERIGRGGKPFRCYKFRTMFRDADAKLNEILASDPQKKQEWDLFHKLKNDPRVTSIGHFLRRSSLDELPQFWNVLKGDLSVVGPRPVVQEEITKHFGAKAHKIFSLRPGITGLWQISGRNDMSYAERIALEEQYVDTRSFIVDCKIILLTVPCMLSKSGAY